MQRIKCFCNSTSSQRFKYQPLSIILSVAILILSCVLLPILTFADEPIRFNFGLPNFLQGDALAIYIRPVVEDIDINFSAENSENLDLVIQPNETQYSRVLMIPKSEGNYNLTISFRIKNPWNYTIGAFTNNKDFYPSNNVEALQFGGYFVRFYTGDVPNPGNFTLTFILYAQARSPSFFSFIFPRSINAVFFITVSILLGYVNAFFLLDLHFKSRVEGVSRKKWFLFGLLIIGSAYIIYEMYILTTFTPTWSV